MLLLAPDPSVRRHELLTLPPLFDYWEVKINIEASLGTTGTASLGTTGTASRFSKPSV